MKVADLVDDLETGDRTMEHLAKGGSEAMSPEEFRNSGLADMLNRAQAGLFGGLGQAALGQQQGLNQLMNQQYANQQWSMQPKMFGGGV